MAKVSYVISKNSSRNGKQNFHFDGGTGSGKWFSKLFKDGKEEHSSEPNEVVDLISKLVVDGDYSINKNSETKIEFEGSVEEIKEFATWSINQVKAESGSLKAVAEFVKEYCKSIVDMFKGIFGYTEHIDDLQAERDQFEVENKKLSKEIEDLRESLKKSATKTSGFDPDAKVEKLSEEIKNLNESLKASGFEPIAEVEKQK